MKHLLVAVLLLLGVQACAPTRSIVIPERPDAPARLAIVPLKGDLGPDAMDLIAEQFAARGIPAREGPSVISLIGYEANITDGSPASAGPLQKYGDDLGVDFILAGTAETVAGPLFTFDRVRMTLRLIDVQTGETRWIGSYGDTVWAAALNTQTDLARAAEHIVKAFDDGGADDLVR
jgi:TolB-like protein